MDSGLLNAFIQAVDAGSFSKAAEKLYISSTALMKQMNVLEAQVGVKLLTRTNHGIHATSAGISLYYDAKFMLQYAEKAIIRARQVANKDPHIIRIANSTLNPCKVLLDVWNTSSETYPQFKMKIVPLDHEAEIWPPVYQTLGKDFDVMVGAYDQAWSGSFQEFKLGEYRVCVAVSREHPLARKDMLSVNDLHDERLVMLKQGVSPLVDEIRHCLMTEHPEIHIKGFDHYHIDVFNRCEESGAVLLTLDGWRDVHPSLVTIPIDWAYTMPYGMLYPREPSNSVLLFLTTLQETEFSNPVPNHG